MTGAQWEIFKQRTACVCVCVVVETEKSRQRREQSLLPQLMISSTFQKSDRGLPSPSLPSPFRCRPSLLGMPLLCHFLGRTVTFIGSPCDYLQGGSVTEEHASVPPQPPLPSPQYRGFHVFSGSVEWARYKCHRRRHARSFSGNWDRWQEL